MRISLRRSVHPAPDNVAHTFIICVLTGLLLWLGWSQVVNAVRSGAPLTGVEARLTDGVGHPLYLWLETDWTENTPPLLWNRIVSTIGWLLSVGMLCRISTRLVSFTGSLPGLMVFLTFPGLTSQQVAAGSGSIGIFFFLLGYSALVLKEPRGAWVRGGGYLALAVVLYPMLLLPVIGLLAGMAEAARVRLVRAGVGFLVTLLVAGGLLSLLAPTGGAWALPGTWGEGAVVSGGWGIRVLQRHFFLLGALAMLLGFGFFRRGPGWWCMVASMTGLFIGTLLSVEAGPALIPVLVVLSLGLARLPVLIELHHPRSYQSVLVCQLLLWIPAVLPSSSDPLLLNPPPGIQAVDVDADTVPTD